MHKTRSPATDKQWTVQNLLPTFTSDNHLDMKKTEKELIAYINQEIHSHT